MVMVYRADIRDNHLNGMKIKQIDLLLDGLRREYGYETHQSIEFLADHGMMLYDIKGHFGVVRVIDREWVRYFVMGNLVNDNAFKKLEDKFEELGVLRASEHKRVAF